MKSTKHIVIPDTQISPGVCVNHLNAAGNYIVDQKPDVIVMLGDWADMHSLSSYDKGTKLGEGVRVKEDIEASKQAMKVLLEPINKYNKMRKKNKKKQYTPRMVLTMGNHENRINRHVNANPELHGFLSTDSLDYESFGWEVHNFLEVVEIDGILYSHYFPRNAQGRIVQTHRGSPNARTQIIREAQSSTSGHLQGLDFAVQQRRDRRDYGLIAGSFYMHEENYLGPQGTEYWRGIIVKHEVQDGNYDPMMVSMNYLLDKWWDGEERYV